MTRSALMILVALAAACGPATPPPVVNPMERLYSASRSELCDGAMAEGLAEVRRSSSDLYAAELERVLRWSINHAGDDCGGGISGVALWRLAIESLGARQGERAPQVLVDSIRVSHNLSQTPGRDREALSSLTEAAFSALSQASMRPEDMTELLEWYRGGADQGCSVAPYRDQILSLVVAGGEDAILTLSQSFPPTPTDGECALGWMLDEALSQASPLHQRRVLAELRSAGPLVTELPRLLEMLDRLEGPLLDFLAGQACDLAVSIARASFDEEGVDPRDPVADTFSACAAVEGGPWRVLELQQRLTRWLISEGEAEEALALVEAAPEEDVSSSWYAEVAAAVVEARLNRDVPVEAAAIFTQMAERLGVGHPVVLRLRDPLNRALLAMTRAFLDGSDVAEARESLLASEQCCGQSETTRRLDLLATLVEVLAVGGSGECPAEQETFTRIRSELGDAREIIRARYDEDEELTELLRSARSAWRPMERRCRRHYRRRR